MLFARAGVIYLERVPSSGTVCPSSLLAFIHEFINSTILHVSQNARACFSQLRKALSACRNLAYPLSKLKTYPLKACNCVEKHNAEYPFDPQQSRPHLRITSMFSWV
jgi:hypothetical protein